MNYLLAFLGLCLYILLGMLKTKNKHSEMKFNYKIYLKDEILSIAVALICAVAIVLMLPDIGSIISPKHAEKTKIISFLGGFLNYSMIKSVINTIAPKKFKEL